MSSTANIYTLLRLYANKQQKTLIPFDEFCSYLQKYAKHYVTEQPDLSKFLNTPEVPLNQEIEELASKNKLLLKESDGKQIIVITAYFMDKINKIYQNMATNPTIPYPIPTDLPNDFPKDLISTQDAADILYELLEGKKQPENVIYSLVFKREVEPVLLSAGVSPDFLIQMSLAKLRQLMHRGEQHDYFQQKLLSSNGGRELAVKNFFSMFIGNEEATIAKLKEAGDSFYFMNQLFLFVRQDYEKIKDRTAEDIALLQSVYITEIAAAFYKNRSQVDLQRETALKNLELAFSKPPYYFDTYAVQKFVDSRGVPLLGQYSEDDLNEYLRQVTTAAGDNELPRLLTFKTTDGTRFFVLNEKVLSLVMKLCTEARTKIREAITKEWYGYMQKFSTTPAMKDMTAFNKRLEELVALESPILYALLNSPFLSVIYYDAREAKDAALDKFRLFENGELVPYNELLVLTQHSIMTDAKILLPVWYTIPILSWIIALFTGKRSKGKTKTTKKDSKTAQQQKANKTVQQKGEATISIYEEHKSQPNASGKKEELKRMASEIEKLIVPPDSTLDSELTSYLNEWNHLLDKTAKKNLVEDVNSLIRDYLRKILRTSSPSSFTLERIKELSYTLAKTPALQKIKDQENLQVYIQLYMLRLIKKA